MAKSDRQKNLAKGAAQEVAPASDVAIARSEKADTHAASDQSERRTKRPKTVWDRLDRKNVWSGLFVLAVAGAVGLIVSKLDKLADEQSKASREIGEVKGVLQEHLRAHKSGGVGDAGTGSLRVRIQAHEETVPSDWSGLIKAVKASEGRPTRTEEAERRAGERLGSP